MVKAVDTIFRSLDFLVTLFNTEKDEANLADYDPVVTMYMIRDTLPIFTEL